MKTENNYYSKLLENIDKLLQDNERFLENKSKSQQYTDIVKEVLEQLNDCFNHKASAVPTLNNFNIYFYELLAKSVINSQPNVEQMRVIRSSIFKEQSINLLLDNITQENVDVVYSMISEHQFTNEDSLRNIESVFSIISNHINKNTAPHYRHDDSKLIFDNDKLKEAFQQLLKNHLEYLKNDVPLERDEEYFDPFSDDCEPVEKKLYSEEILDSVKKIFHHSVWHEFTNLLPVLPPRDATQSIFSINKCPIIELDINNQGVLGNYYNLMNQKDIYTMARTVVHAISLCTLRDVSYVKMISLKNEKDVSLLIKSSNENLPPIEKIDKLLKSAFEFYNENASQYSFLSEDSYIFKKFIEKEWLDLSVPFAHKKDTIKKKI